MFYSKKLKKFSNIKHVFFSRKEGFSRGIYKGLNCGRGSKDNRKHILKNLKYVCNKMNVNEKNLILMNQTHSNKVIEIKKNNYLKKINSDAIVTKKNEYALGVLTADCVPILLYDKKNKIIGCIHAGWKGAFSDIIRKTVEKIKRMSSKNEIYACIGPCIGKKSYEVDLFFSKIYYKVKKILNTSQKNESKKLFNLRKFVADKLIALNVKVDHLNFDTFKEKTNFYSFRRSKILNQNDYGRCISVIKLI